MLSRLALLFSLSWVISLKDDLFFLLGQGISGRDIVLLLGGVFLLYKASHEIFVEVEAREQDGPPKIDAASAKSVGGKLFWVIVTQIAVIDIIFSLDSVITAVGMADQLWVMVVAVIIAMIIMLSPPRRCRLRRGAPDGEDAGAVVPVADRRVADRRCASLHVPKGYVYFALAFSVAVETLNIRARNKRRAVESHESSAGV